MFPLLLCLVSCSSAVKTLGKGIAKDGGVLGTEGRKVHGGGGVLGIVRSPGLLKAAAKKPLFPSLKAPPAKQVVLGTVCSPGRLTAPAKKPLIPSLKVPPAKPFLIELDSDTEDLFTGLPVSASAATESHVTDGDQGGVASDAQAVVIHAETPGEAFCQSPRDLHSHDAWNDSLLAMPAPDMAFHAGATRDE